MGGKWVKKGSGLFKKLFGKVPGCNSFTPETPVVMADGSTKPIRNVRIGDKVLAGDPVGGRTEAKPVEDVITGDGSKHLVELTVDTDGDKGGATGTITATDAHPFWLQDQHAWVKARDIAPGAMLRTSAGTSVQVTAVRAWTAPQQVFNLTVSDLHTYYTRAGAAPVLVHNASCPVGFRDLGGSKFESPGGLVYGPGSAHGHRLDHVLAHATPDPSKVKHSVFANGNQRDIVNLIDEGWAKRGAHVPGDPAAFIVPMGKAVGTAGEQSLRIVVAPGTNKIISAYPWA
ncbi:polymorphic toxin-type HINT domain-containing protein [Streptomyces syringium]|uniref:polymorphic toxin-type HINT domain-containing protein n=1 Tax=Streptomyces syringium TaxID=76729 RepID=UPI0037D77EA3